MLQLQAFLLVVALGRGPGPASSGDPTFSDPEALIWPGILIVCIAAAYYAFNHLVVLPKTFHGPGPGQKRD